MATRKKLEGDYGPPVERLGVFYMTTGPASYHGWKITMRRGHQLRHVPIPDTDKDTTKARAERLAKQVVWQW